MRVWALFAGVVLVAGAFLVSPAAAQSNDPPPATLIADTIDFNQQADLITASGSVEIFFEGSRLRATSVTYSGADDRVRVQGPLTLTQENGRTVILADFADLSADLQEGVLSGARMVLDRQLQIAATEIDHSEGRYTQAYQVVTSSCEVCADNPTPLWEIRARRIIHDRTERQLYFENATFRALGVPIGYLPRLRLPDPTVERATGLLVPSIQSNDELGFRVRVPYFFRLGDHADLTVAPWLGGDNTNTVDLRYRQAFVNGEIEIEGAISEDNLTPDDQRGYIFLEGQFDLARDFTLDFGIEGVSDRGYLTTYGFPSRELLESFARVSRTRRDEYIEIGASSFVGLRSTDDNETLPTQVINAHLQRRFVPRWIGGIATASLDGGGYYRISDTEGVNGRDVARLTGSVDWRRETVLPVGIVVAFEGALYADIYNTQQGGTLTGTETRVSPMAAIEARYPLSQTSARGVTHLIEPVVQLAWSDTSGGAIPAEDSAIVEFDEANLFSLNRFPGQDQREDGRRANIGLGYTRVDPLGWTVGVLGGLVLRDTGTQQFTNGSGLAGTQSDFLLAAHVTLDGRWRVINRSLFDENLEFTSNELSLGWAGDAHMIETSFTFLEADASEGRPLDTSEWAFDASYQFRRNWEAAVNWRYDFEEESATRAELGISYENECVDMAFSVSRRFTNSVTVTPTTEFGFTVALNGFGANRSGRSHNRSCQR